MNCTPLFLFEAAKLTFQNIPMKKRISSDWLTRFTIPKLKRIDEQESNISVTSVTPVTSDLKLKPLAEFAMDEKIRELHSQNDDALFEQYFAQIMNNAPIYSEDYIKAHSAMIHFEELANHHGIAPNLNLKNVSIILHSQAEQLFKIKNDVSVMICLHECVHLFCLIYTFPGEREKNY